MVIVEHHENHSINILNNISFHTGESQMSNIHPPPAIPVGCYDCADGFYDPKTRVITSYSGMYLRSAGESKIQYCIWFNLLCCSIYNTIYYAHTFCKLHTQINKRRYHTEPTYRSSVYPFRSRISLPLTRRQTGSEFP